MATVDRADVLIVGGGIIGLTLARELVALGRTGVVVLEKEPELGRHASGRNSGVLHAGIYYAPETLKARSCLSGNRLMRAYCKDKGLPLVEAGKVVVARSEEEQPVLEELHRRAVANGARVELIDEKQLAEIEPAARSAGRALFSRDTAVVDPKAILAQLRADLEMSGCARVLTGRTFVGLTAGPIRYERFVNAAGAHCDRVARHFGVGLEYRLIPFKGIYRKLRHGVAFEVRGNIYPVPDIRNPFLGVHFTRSAQGDVYVGPTAIPAFGRENYGVLGGLTRSARPARPRRDHSSPTEVPRGRAHRTAQVHPPLVQPRRSTTGEGVPARRLRAGGQGGHPAAARRLADQAARHGLPRGGEGRVASRAQPGLARVHELDASGAGHRARALPVEPG
jgi:L-2-hydroxyglutarate oxidase LhgO